MLKMIMKRDLHQNKSGFTLVEVMMAVAILIILTGVSFVGVVNYQRSLNLLEKDGIAKEIYVAAQNHLTMLEGMGYPGIQKKGKEENKTYYFAVNNNSKDTPFIPGDCNFDNSMLGQMLPFGSVDETVRKGGNYIIHYQTNPALVLDVCYSDSRGGVRFNHEFTEGECNKDFTTLMKNKGARIKYTDDSVIGYYGAQDAASLETVKFETPTIKVINAEKLIVEVTNPVANEEAPYSYLQVLVKGVTSPGETIIHLKLDSGATGGNLSSEFDYIQEDNKYTIVLDDVTEAGKHFYDLFNSSGFYPGEDITIQAIVSSTSKLANVAKSVEQTTNSLFAEISTEEGGTVQNTASIENIRHLENMDYSVSRVRTVGNDVAITKGEQASDLSWPDFKTAIGGEKVSIYPAGTSISGGTQGYFYPVSPSTAVTYAGNSYQISGVEVDLSASGSNNSPAGLFGELKAHSVVKDIELIDFSIKAVGDSAGALAGSASTTTVTNVIAYCSTPGTYENSNKIESASGSAGGLIGSMSGGTVEKSAAIMPVESKNGNAGGLIGTISASGDDKGKISSCYTGGHTKDGAYDAEENTSATLPYNVKGTGLVGGLVGQASGSEIKYSYSTCSASGGTTGGLIGNGSGSLENCYATGLVSGSTKGAFAGTFNGAASGCRYFSIINEIEKKEDNKTTGYDYLKAVAGSSTAPGTDYSGISAFDDESGAGSTKVSAAENYNNFLSKYSNGTVSREWAAAVPYDTTLGTYYNNQYPLRSVYHLSNTTAIPTSETGYYVQVHYGDWPAPEIFVKNTKSGTTVPDTVKP